MTLELERLTPQIVEMAQAIAQQRTASGELLDEFEALLETYATDWERIERALETAAAQADQKHYRSAKPLASDESPLNAQIAAGNCPSEAIIVATDGSQIMPDRHAAYLYYVINIGGVVYYHGNGRSPQQFTWPTLRFPDDDEETNFVTSSGEVSIQRDLQEIGHLADLAWENRSENCPVLAVLDQRLLYWPVGSTDSALNEDTQKWLKAMDKLHDSNALLAGYIDRPMTSAVLTLLRAIQGLDDPQFDWKSLGKRPANGGLTDAALFRRLLGPGERSRVFVMVSPVNEQFAHYQATHEVCFFYMNPGTVGQQIARVDIPRWVAEDAQAVTAVHNLIYTQCQLLGTYPYIIARADEMAVIRHEEHRQLDQLIDNIMQRHNVSGSLTGKQTGKNLARGDKRRFGL
ncbi:MAG: hypothetical protein D6706_15525 [Chloroflexi bacterium]|nr:MAG: hypothetical protein D6706_15525 [Chloroflexota bacterium]